MQQQERTKFVTQRLQHVEKLAYRKCLPKRRVAKKARVRTAWGRLPTRPGIILMLSEEKGKASSDADTYTDAMKRGMVRKVQNVKDKQKRFQESFNKQLSCAPVMENQRRARRVRVGADKHELETTLAKQKHASNFFKSKLRNVLYRSAEETPRIMVRRRTKMMQARKSGRALIRGRPFTRNNRGIESNASKRFRLIDELNTLNLFSDAVAEIKNCSAAGVSTAQRKLLLLLRDLTCRDTFTLTRGNIYLALYQRMLTSEIAAPEVQCALDKLLEGIGESRCSFEKWLATLTAVHGETEKKSPQKDVPPMTPRSATLHHAAMALRK